MGLIAGIALVLVVGGFMVYYMPGILPVSVTNPVINTGPTGQPTSSNPLINVNRPIPLITTNAMNGSLAVSTTITIMKPDGTLLETLTSDGSTAKVTTSNSYPSGTQLIIEVAKTNFVTQEFAFTVPQMLQSDSYGTTNNYQLNVPIYGKGSFTMVVTDSAGTSYTNASTVYNWTTKGTTSDTFTVTIYSTANYEGWRDSHDVVNNVDWNYIVSASDNGTKCSITGANQVVNWGGTAYYLWQIPQDSTLRLVSGNNVQKAGVYSFQFTVNKGSMASGTEEIFTFTPEFYASGSTFSQTGSFGSAASAGSVFELLLGS